MPIAKYTHIVTSNFRNGSYQDLNQLIKELNEDGYKGATKSKIIRAAFTEMIRTKTYNEIIEMLKQQNII